MIGRWSVLGDEERLSPDERDEARAQLLLARYGIVARELARGDWATLRHTLLRMEYGGEVVRGYFVQGLSGEQYALADALGDLDTPARRAEPHVLVNMIDPANLWGRVFALSRRDGSRACRAPACLRTGSSSVRAARASSWRAPDEISRRWPAGRTSTFPA